jgi:hypothetical protein
MGMLEVVHNLPWELDSLYESSYLVIVDDSFFEAFKWYNNLEKSFFNGLRVQSLSNLDTSIENEFEIYDRIVLFISFISPDHASDIKSISSWFKCPEVILITSTSAGLWNIICPPGIEEDEIDCSSYSVLIESLKPLICKVIYIPVHSFPVFHSQSEKVVVNVNNENRFL